MALAGLWTAYHLYAAPEPSVSTLKLENGRFCLGYGCRKQPDTLEDYVQMTAEHLFRFHDNRLTFWPVDVYGDHSVVFVSGDRARAWEVIPELRSLRAVDPGTIAPIISTVKGYPDEFFPLFRASDGVERDTFVQVIREDEMANQKRSEKYVYLGTYDKFLSYVHEGFHVFGQGGAKGEWPVPAFLGNRDRTSLLEAANARMLRAQLFDQLHKALAAEGTARDDLVRQAMATYRHYADTEPEDARTTRFIDRQEGVARYIEVAAALRSTHPQINTMQDQVDAAGLVATYYGMDEWIGAVDEAYALGEAAGFLLDHYLAGDPSTWKRRIIHDREATPVGILAETIAAVFEPVAYQPPSDQFRQDARAAMTRVAERGVNWKGLIVVAYHMIF